MATRRKRQGSSPIEGIQVRQLEVIFVVGTAIAGIAGWSYSTFATKEQTQQIVAMIDNNKKDQAAQIELLRNSLIEVKHDNEKFSDRNRERMEGLFEDLKQEVLSIKQEILQRKGR